MLITQKYIKIDVALKIKKKMCPVANVFITTHALRNLSFWAVACEGETFSVGTEYNTSISLSCFKA